MVTLCQARSASSFLNLLQLLERLCVATSCRFPETSLPLFLLLSLALLGVEHIFVEKSVRGIKAKQKCEIKSYYKSTKTFCNRFVVILLRSIAVFGFNSMIYIFASVSKLCSSRFVKNCASLDDLHSHCFHSHYVTEL